MLAVLLVAGIALGRWQSVQRTLGRMTPFDGGIQRVVSVTANPILAVERFTGDYFGSISKARNLEAQNAMLKARLGALALYEEQLALKDVQVDQLRRSQNLPPEPGHTRIWADVIGYSQYESRIRISVGSEKGVAAGMPVVNSDGLIGIVQTVREGASEVLLITSYGAQLGCIDINRTPPIVGFVKGRDASTLTFTMLDPNANIVTGDTIVTSGFSDMIPSGIRVGRVIAIQDDADFGMKRATLDPSVNLGAVREVQVLK